MEKRNQNYVRLLAAIANTYLSPNAITLTDDEIEELNSMMATLTDKEKRVLVERFGLEDGNCKTLRQVEEIFGVTKGRIQQIETKALRKLRHPSRFGRCKVKERIDEMEANSCAEIEGEATTANWWLEKPKEWREALPKTLDWEDVPIERRMTPEMVIQIRGDHESARREAHHIAERLRDPEHYCAMAIDYGSRWNQRYGIYAQCARRVRQPGKKYCATHDPKRHSPSESRLAAGQKPEPERVKAISIERWHFMSVVCPRCGSRNNLTYNLEVGRPYRKRIVFECYLCGRELLEMEVKVSLVIDKFRN